MEHKIGTTFKFKNRHLKVVESEKCEDCYFNEQGLKCVKPLKVENCNRVYRKDSRDVRFVEVTIASSPKQIQARRRAFMIMQLEGMVTNLKTMRDVYVRAWFLKGMINTCIGAIQQLLYRLKDLTNKSSIPRTTEFNRRLLEIERCETWHELFNSN